jgi:hypothetical protein
MRKYCHLTDRGKREFSAEKRRGLDVHVASKEFWARAEAAPVKG